jgi:hypothetical protein
VTGNRKFGRVVAVQVQPQSGAPLRVEGLRISATVRRALGEAVDDAEVVIYNPEDTVLAILREGAVVRLLAGYGTPSEIISGGVSPLSVKFRRSAPNPTVTFGVQDGGVALREAPLSLSWSESVKASAVINRILLSSTLGRGVISLDNDVEYTRGHVVYGSARDALMSIARDCGCEFTVQNNNINLWPKGGERLRSAVVISEATGMLDNAVAGENGSWVVSVLLEPSIRPGDVVRVKDPGIFDGVLRVQEVTHRVDSGWDNSFTTEITGFPA